MKLKAIYFVLSIVAFLLVSGCAITHKFGPYSGKVVDAETNEPIEGAVVLLRFSTEAYTLAGFNADYADALETMTDNKGAFKVPGHRITLFRVPHRWWPYGDATIFKPGYGCYPHHKDISPMFMPNGSIPENEYVTIKLPKLKTKEERIRNTSHFPMGVPDKKMRKLIELNNVEGISLGLKPSHILEEKK